MDCQATHLKSESGNFDYLPLEVVMEGSAACNCSAGCVRVDLDRSFWVTVRLPGSALDVAVLDDG